MFSNNIIKKRFIILFIFIILSFGIITYRLVDLIIINKNEYMVKLSIENRISYVSKYAKRGRIIDRNGNIIVDNEIVYNIIYIKNSDVTSKEELELASELSKFLDLEYTKASELDLKKYFYIKNKSLIDERINKNVKMKYENRSISSSKYQEYLYKLIKNDEINNMSLDEKKSAYFYSLMNEGYRNSAKIIKSNITSEEVNIINKYNKEGFSTSVTYKRVYPYGEVFKEYLGTIGSIPEEQLNDYLNLGYKRDAIVGISYLESEYEKYLSGTNEEYVLSASGEKIIVSELKDGNDLILSIDINLQKDIENIIHKQIMNAKKESNTSYYNKSYVIISNPNTGEIIASAATGVINNKNYSKVNYLTDLTNYSVTPGSIVKAASHIAGYKNGVLDIGYSVTDGCIKVKNTPRKCSWKSLGRINDLTALKLSSNYYQFLMAIKMGNGNYTYNKGLNLDISGFKKYRDVFNQFGLGVKTGIDLPNEGVGVIGTDNYSGALLDYPIGQYETYTPMQLMQYINTVATGGKRYSLHYLKDVKSGDEVIYSYEPNILNEVDIESKYMDRVKEGLRLVMMSGGTGVSHINKNYNAAGKTGTAQSFIDTNYDGKIDTETTSSNFGAYMPYDKPKISIVVLSPNISNRQTSFTSKANRKITKEITDLYFTKYN